MKGRTPRFISQFAALQAEPPRRKPTWRRTAVVFLLVCAAALAAYDIFWVVARST